MEQPTPDFSPNSQLQEKNQSSIMERMEEHKTQTTMAINAVFISKSYCDQAHLSEPEIANTLAALEQNGNPNLESPFEYPQKQYEQIREPLKKVIEALATESSPPLSPNIVAGIIINTYNTPSETEVAQVTSPNVNQHVSETLKTIQDIFALSPSKMERIAKIIRTERIRLRIPELIAFSSVSRNFELDYFGRKKPNRDLPILKAFLQNHSPEELLQISSFDELSQLLGDQVTYKGEGEPQDTPIEELRLIDPDETIDIYVLDLEDTDNDSPKQYLRIPVETKTISTIESFKLISLMGKRVVELLTARFDGMAGGIFGFNVDSDVRQLWIDIGDLFSKAAPDAPEEFSKQQNLFRFKMAVLLAEYMTELSNYDTVEYVLDTKDKQIAFEKIVMAIQATQDYLSLTTKTKAE